MSKIKRQIDDLSEGEYIELYGRAPLSAADAFVINDEYDPSYDVNTLVYGIESSLYDEDNIY